MNAHAQTPRPQATYVPSPRQPRKEPRTPWSLAMQGWPWSEQDKSRLAAMWKRPDLHIEDVAAALQRSVAACRGQACNLHLGLRPSEQSYGCGTRGRPRSQRIADPHEQQPVALRPTQDGVVLTRRLTQAWERVTAGADAAAVAADLRLTAVEAAALRRWSADT